MTDDRIETIAKQLHIQSNTRIWVGGNCNEAKHAIAPYLALSSRPAQGPIDVAVITPESIEEALYFANKLRKRLNQDATVWIMFSGKIQPFELNQQCSKAMEQSGWVELNKISINHSFIAVGYARSPVDKNTLIKPT